MTLPLTKGTAAAAYEFLRATPPYCRLKLPPSETIKFSIIKSRKVFGEYFWDGSSHCIRLSSNAIGHTDTLLRTMAHEIIHLHLEDTGQEAKGTSETVHNEAFRKIAARACKVHGWDEKAFY